MEKKGPTYKEAYTRLLEIQQLIEDNRLDVDDLNNVLKEAASLLKLCKDKLFVVSEETQKILKDIG